ncbi:MAG: hypothetical protein IJV35_06265 [Neisseriaceae bacterium]|nr:hypothetical protein [Neisseriaceae bacterium]
MSLRDDSHSLAVFPLTNVSPRASSVGVSKSNRGNPIKNRQIFYQRRKAL